MPKKQGTDSNKEFNTEILKIGNLSKIKLINNNRERSHGAAARANSDTRSTGITDGAA